MSNPISLKTYIDQQNANGFFKGIAERIYLARELLCTYHDEIRERQKDKPLPFVPFLSLDTITIEKVEQTEYPCDYYTISFPDIDFKTQSRRDYLEFRKDHFSNFSFCPSHLFVTKRLWGKVPSLNRDAMDSYIIYINENHVDIKVVRNDTGAEVQTGASIPYNTSLTISFTTNSGYHDGWCDYSGQTINMPADNLTINSGATQDSNCVAKGTLVKTADFRDVPIEKLNAGDLILSWDYRTKSWTATPITLLVYHGDSLTDIVTLEFSNGRKIKVVDSHEFYDVSKRSYVTIGLYNFSEYLGDLFVCYNDGDGIDTVQLVNAYKSQEYTGSYTIVSSYFYNCITNDIVSATPNIPGIYELISSYLDADLNFDSQLLQEDIDKYGIYEYDLFAECLSYEQYSGLCAAYFKIAAGKGYTTFEEIYYLMMMFSYVYL